jgi:glycosyltransferase involved in cell wall biosynthesis
LISFLKHCAHVIAPTQSMYDIITQKYHPRCPVSVIPTPVDITRYSHLEPGSKRSDWNIPEGELLLYLGRLSPEKNLNLLLDAFRLVSDARPNAHLVLIGKGPSEDALKQLTRELNLTNRVHFVGSAPHEQTPGCLAAADLFVFPSQIETQGLSILEAMAAGTPVIALDAPGVSEIVRMGGGKLAAAATPEAFARTIIDLLDSPEQRAALRAAGLYTASQFSLAQSAQKLTDVYRQALASVTAPV